MARGKEHEGTDCRTGRLAVPKLIGYCVRSNNAMSNAVLPTHLLYQGPLGLIVCQKASFFASKNGFPIGTYDTFEEAMAALAGKGRDKSTEAS
jgi:hypothetical protein